GGGGTRLWLVGGAWGQMSMGDEGKCYSNSRVRARENADSERVRLATARAEAMPKRSLCFLPCPSPRRSPGDSWVPANQEPTMTCEAPAANARATSRG